MHSIIHRIYFATFSLISCRSQKLLYADEYYEHGKNLTQQPCADKPCTVCPETGSHGACDNGREHSFQVDKPVLSVNKYRQRRYGRKYIRFTP